MRDTPLLAAGSFIWNIGKIKPLNGDQIAEKYKNNVVQLSSEFSNGEANHGFGFVVGERDNKLFVVTANHVVRSNNNPDIKTKEILIKFHSNKGKSFKAEPLELSVSDIDLTLLEIEKPSDYTWERKHYGIHVERGEEVWFIGRNRDWFVPPRPGFIIESASFANSYHKVDISGARPGTSGAPLFTKNGIIGMIIADSADEVIVLDIKVIQDVITKKWNYPWQLEPLN